jgi:cobalt/nickel transport system ATP-binding protein
VFRLQKCSVAFNGKYALEDIDLEINSGERVVIIGINGSGKSTLLKLLDGLLEPSSGEVFYKNQSLVSALAHDAAVRRMFRKEVVLLFQNIDAMLFNPTVRDEIAFAPKQLGLKDIDQTVNRWADTFGIAELLDLPPFTLSGGEKKKVALAAIMAVEPEVLLLDEPSAHVDPAGVAWFVDFLQSLAGKTVVCSTHNLSLVAELGDRVIALSKDRTIMFDGTPAQLFSDSALLIESGLAHKHLHRHLDEVHRHYHVHNQDS